MMNNYQIPRAESPESVGVSSAVVKEFLEGMKDAGLEYHSLFITRHGKVAVEFYNKPFCATAPHTMYSASKTWCATAIGLAIDEGFFSLDSRVIDIFPEYRPEKKEPYLEKLTIEHLLTMSAGKGINLLEDKSKIDWLKQFFKSPWKFEPGTDFLYVNENVYMQASIIKRVTGLTVLQFLKHRLFDPMAIELPFWETDEFGTEAGGWGLYIKTEDLAKLMLCYSQKGVLNGRQILPVWWTEKATQAQVDNGANVALNCSAGYGYCIWRCGSIKNAYRADGMFGQFGIVLEDYDATITITAAVAMEEESLEYIFKHFPRAFFDETKEVPDTVPNWKKYLRSFSVDTPMASKHFPMENSLRGKTILITNNRLLQTIGFPLSVLPIAVTYMTTDKAGNPDKFQLAFSDSMLKIRWTEGDEINTVYCGMDGKMRGGTIKLGKIEYDVCAYAYWESERVLEVHIRPYTTIAKRILRFEFDSENKVTVIPTCTPNIAKITEFLGASAGDLIKNENLLKMVPSFLNVLSKVIEPKLKGKIV